MARVPDPRQRNPFVAFNNFGTQVPMTAPGGAQFGNAPMQQGNSEGPNLPNTMPFPGGGTMAPGGNPWPDGNGMPMPNLRAREAAIRWPVVLAGTVGLFVLIVAVAVGFEPTEELPPHTRAAGNALF